MFRSQQYPVTLIVLVLCISTFTAFAQTPTPHPNALGPGYYEFASLSSPDIELSGVWTITDNQLRPVLRSNSNGGTMTFFTKNVSYGLILSTGASSNDYRICVDGVCEARKSTTSGFSPDFFTAGNSIVEFYNDDSDNTAFLSLQLFPDYDTLGSVSGTVTIPTATPNPAIIYGTISGISGTYATEFHNIVTAGDVAVSSALLFLFFSLVSAFMGLLFNVWE